jgi:predicted RNA-binding Zn-ribbon protein involved in translation (DUF1610 family)
MRRNNEDRLMGGHKPTPSEEVPQMPNPMDFVTPTEIVDLPSLGRYPEGHPLSGKETIEIRHMTAKDEDILTNRSMLKKGIAIDRLLQNLMKDKNIDARTLYVGDRNAVLIHARASAYGQDYKTKIQCPACGETSKFKFDLSDHEVYHGDKWEEFDIEETERGTFKTTLPLSTIVAEIRPLVGLDELKLVKEQKGKDGLENIITKQMKMFTVSFNGYTEEHILAHVADNMVATDSRYLRDCFKIISPDVKMEGGFECRHCGHEEVITVPFGADFFWPDR